MLRFCNFQNSISMMRTKNKPKCGHERIQDISIHTSEITEISSDEKEDKHSHMRSLNQVLLQ